MLTSPRLRELMTYDPNTVARSSSGRKGVTWHRQAGKWQASIQARGRSRYLGLFDSVDSAAAAYAVASAEMHGEFGRLS